MQPVEISPDAPNIFEKQPAKPGKSKPGAKSASQKGGKAEKKADTPPPPPSTEPETEIIPISEEETEQPKELIG